MKLEEIQRFLPNYLSSESKDELFEEIKKFINKEDSDKIFTTFLLDQKTIFQGDGMKGFKFFSFETEEIKISNGIVLSNTCDISLENERLYPNQILFSPIISLKKYTDLLEKNGINEQKLKSHIDSIRNQEITTIFYLPATSNNFEESIVFLDRISNMRNSREVANQLLEGRIFTLSNFGFYLFLLKISVHFTRIKEGVDRRSA